MRKSLFILKLITNNADNERNNELSDIYRNASTQLCFDSIIMVTKILSFIVLAALAGECASLFSKFVLINFQFTYASCKVSTANAYKRVSRQPGFSASFEAAKSCQTSGGCIDGGRVAPINSYGWTVSINTYGSVHFCSGTIIATNRILTSARCIADATYPRPIQIRVGSYESRVGGHLLFIDSIHPHPDYNATTLQNDIAIIKLRNSIDLNWNGIQMLKLPDLYDTIEDGTVVVTSGWHQGQCSPSTRVMYEMKIISNTDCNGFFRGGIVNTQICAEVPLRIDGTAPVWSDELQNDAGGPVVDLAQKTVVGIVSWGHGSACGWVHRRPAVYTWIAYYREWIASYL